MLEIAPMRAERNLLLADSQSLRAKNQSHLSRSTNMSFQTNPVGALLATGLILACPTAYANAAGGGSSCGYISSEAGIVPTSNDIYLAAINQIDGVSPTTARYQYKLNAGKHILLIGDRIESLALNNAQLIQIEKMKSRSRRAGYFKTPRSTGNFKTLTLDVQPGTSYRLGVRLLRDKLDAQNIRDNAYWEPVVWEEVAQACA